MFLKALKETAASFKCTYATGAAHATELLRYLNPDYIFFDLPVESSETHRMIQTIHNKRSLFGCKYFLYAAEIAADIRRRATELGAAGCVQKSRMVSALAEALGSALGERKEYPVPAIVPVYPMAQPKQSSAV